MDRLFLINLVKEGAGMAPPPARLPTGKHRNRRLSERHSIAAKGLTFFFMHDLFVLEDISEAGFSAKVSSRAFAELKQGDTYVCRFRFQGEPVEGEATLKWKLNQKMGFEVSKSSPRLLELLARLLKPMEIATHWVKQRIDLPLESHDHKIPEWYTSLFQSNFFVQRDLHDHLQGWHFEDSQIFIRWQPSGLSTGRVLTPPKLGELPALPGELPHARLRLDPKPDTQKLKNLKDILTLSSFSNKADILMMIP